MRAPLTAKTETRFLTKLRELADYPAHDMDLAKFAGIAKSKVSEWKRDPRRLKPTMHVWGILRERVGVENTMLLFRAALDDEAELRAEIADAERLAAIVVARGRRATSTEARRLQRKRGT